MAVYEHEAGEDAARRRRAGGRRRCVCGDRAIRRFLAGVIACLFLSAVPATAEQAPAPDQQSEVDVGWIGVKFGDIDESTKKRLGFAAEYGCLVGTVLPAGPAFIAGVRPDDVLLTVNGEKVSGAMDARTHIRAHKPGDMVPVSVWRAGKEQTLTLVLSSQRAYDTSQGIVGSLYGHVLPVSSLAVSPDGRFVLSGSQDHTLKLWDVSSGKLVRTFQGHSDAVYSVALSSDGTRALSGSGDRTIKVWAVASGQLLRTLEGHGDIVGSVAFSPDGRQALSGSSDHTVKLWDVATGHCIRTFEGHTDMVGAVAFSPDGRFVVSASDDGTIKVWDVATGEATHTLQIGSAVRAAAWSPDGKYILCGTLNGDLKFWTADGSLGRSWQNDPHPVVAAVFSTDGRYALTGSHGGSVKVWDVGTGQPLHDFDADASDVEAVAVSPDGQLAFAAGWNGHVDADRLHFVIKEWNLKVPSKAGH